MKAGASQIHELISHFESGVWDVARTHDLWLKSGVVANRRATERKLVSLGVCPAELQPDTLRDELGRRPNKLVVQSEVTQARACRKLVLFAQLHTDSLGRHFLHANDGRGARTWVMTHGNLRSKTALSDAWNALLEYAGKEVLILPHGELVAALRAGTVHHGASLLAYGTLLDWHEQHFPNVIRRDGPCSPQLQRLEDESIYVLREAVAEAERPVMLYSAGKDSGVLLHLARKAFHPGPIPFPLLHVDTRWKFQEMYRFRDFMAQRYGAELITYVNPEAIAKDINPFDHGSSLHTHITKTEGLKRVLRERGFDVVIGGARRDEERSRAKERVFSIRNPAQAWDPKNQRPEPWNLYNTRKPPGYSFRVFPLSNWTELDVWQYTKQESIPVVPLYFARTHPVLVRDDMLMVVDDERCRIAEGERTRTTSAWAAAPSAMSAARCTRGR